MKDNLIPLVAQNQGVVLVGGNVQIKIGHDLGADQIRTACTTCKRFVTGVLEYEGGYVGTLCEHVRAVRSGERSLAAPGELTLTGVATERVRVSRLVRGEGLFDVDYVEVEPWPYLGYTPSAELEALVDELNERKQAIEAYDDGEMEPGRKRRHAPNMSVDSIHLWIDKFGPMYAADENDMAKLLVESEVEARLAVMNQLLVRVSILREVERGFRDEVEDSIRESQKEYFLREELRIINEELYGSGETELQELEAMIEDSEAPEEVRDRLRKELRKMNCMQPQSPESYVTHNYIETVCSLPWNSYTKDDLSIENARAVLEADHYGLEKVKERILEFLTVHKMGNQKGSILCLYGPPGVGKTSVARSIARALGRKYVRLSLGGMHDEAEIRGHRRTYIAAMPGKIVTSLKRAESMNPVFLLDEVDKLSNDYKGDPASALLEVLDPEQNKAFLDNYLDVPIDLSRVLFITTANNIGEIARPLLDRMELIELTGYTPEEKLEIAKRHLLPKQVAEHHMPEGYVQLTDEALSLVIEGYTREAGVRSLEKTIASLCRKVAVSFGDGEMKPVVLDEGAVRGYLGVARFESKHRERVDSVGCVCGLAWTELGGEVLELEGVLMNEAGHLKLTGNLGKVMRESAMIAFGYIKAHADEFGIARENLTKELHIHAPEGAVPKDGPSAGCALAVLMVSVLSGKKVRQDVALTGEISLTGRVLAIGGVKEKALGALREGITTVLVPKENERDVAELPSSLRERVRFVFVSHIREVLEVMLRDR